MPAFADLHNSSEISYNFPIGNFNYGKESKMADGFFERLKGHLAAAFTSAVNVIDGEPKVQLDVPPPPLRPALYYGMKMWEHDR